MAENGDAIELQRRARRRLLGAVALALFIAIVLPIVFEPEPKPITQDLVVTIPSPDSAVERRLPRPMATPAAPAGNAAGPKQPNQAAEAKPPTQSVLTAEPQPAPARPDPGSPAEAHGAGKSEAAARKVPATDQRVGQVAVERESFIVPLGAYSNAGNARQVLSRLATAGYKGYSEKFQSAKGEQLRVRAGPFASRDAAEAAREKFKSLGFNPVGPVAVREQP